MGALCPYGVMRSRGEVLVTRKRFPTRQLAQAWIDGQSEPGLEVCGLDQCHSGFQGSGMVWGRKLNKEQ